MVNSRFAHLGVQAILLSGGTSHAEQGYICIPLMQLAYKTLIRHGS